MAAPEGTPVLSLQATWPHQAQVSRYVKEASKKTERRQGVGRGQHCTKKCDCHSKSVCDCVGLTMHRAEVLLDCWLGSHESCVQWQDTVFSDGSSERASECDTGEWTKPKGTGHETVVLDIKPLPRKLKKCKAVRCTVCPLLDFQSDQCC